MVVISKKERTAVGDTATSLTTAGTTATLYAYWKIPL